MLADPVAVAADAVDPSALCQPAGTVEAPEDPAAPDAAAVAPVEILPVSNRG